MEEIDEKELKRRQDEIKKYGCFYTRHTMKLEDLIEEIQEKVKNHE